MDAKLLLLSVVATVAMSFVACQKVEDKQATRTRNATASENKSTKPDLVQRKDGKWYDKNGKVVTDEKRIQAEKNRLAEQEKAKSRGSAGSQEKMDPIFKTEADRIRVLSRVLLEADNIFNEIWVTYWASEAKEAKRKTTAFAVLRSALKTIYKDDGSKISEAKKCDNIGFNAQEKIISEYESLLKLSKERCSESNSEKEMLQAAFADKQIKLEIKTADLKDGVGDRLAAQGKPIVCRIELTDKQRIAKLDCSGLGHTLDVETHMEMDIFRYEREARPDENMITILFRLFKDQVNPVEGQKSKGSFVAIVGSDKIIKEHTGEPAKDPADAKDPVKP